MAVAILLVGLLAGLMIAQPSLDQALEDLKDARESLVEEMTSLKNTKITINSANFNNTTSVLNITLENDGSNEISMEDLDILLNGTFVAGGVDNSGYFYPGQEHMVSLKNITDPRSVKVVGPWGISDTATKIGRG